MNENLNDWLDAFLEAGGAVFRASLFALIFIALFGASAAGAQLTMPDGKLNTFCAAVPRPQPLPVPAPMSVTGLPKQLGGACTEFVATADAKGGALAYWCAAITPENARLRLFAVKWDAVTLPMLLDFAQLGLPGIDKEALMSSMHSKYRTLDIKDMCDIWHPLVDRLNAIYPAPLPLPPAPGAWIAYGGAIYKYANGKLLSVVPGKTAAKGAPCTGVTVSIAGALTYQPLVGGPPDEATRCVKLTTLSDGEQRVRDALNAQGLAIDRARAAIADAIEIVRSK